MAIGGLLLFVFSARASLRAIRHPDARRWLLVGAVGVVLYPLAFYSAMDLAGVAIGNVVSLGSGPVFAAVLERLWERRRPSVRWLACTAVALAGILLLALSGGADAGDNVIGGVALGLVAGFSYALYSYASTRAIAVGHQGRAVMGGMFGIGALALLPVLLLTGAPLLRSWEAAGIAAYLAIGPMFLAYLLFGMALASIRSSVATTVTLVEPLVATVLAVLVVGERLSPGSWFGLLLIMVAIGALVSARQPVKLLPAS
jgi:DME family drug/metabolite transporter